MVPKFFFDLDDGVLRTTDNEGLEAVDLHEAKEKAVAALPQIARDALPDGDKLTVSARVRDENGRVRIMATLTLEVATYD